MTTPGGTLLRCVSAAHSWRAEVAAAIGLYAVYELVRSLGGEAWGAAQMHTEQIVRLEQLLGVYWERPLQDVSLALPGAGTFLGIAYIGLHVLGTTAFLVWVYRRRQEAFPLVRTAIVIATGLSLVGYLAYPAAPPRLAGLGFADTVSERAGVNLSSDLLGALYNPLAAVPSLHFGYALLVGLGLAQLASTSWVRRAGHVYPVVMLFVIVATGNHFFVDAAAGALVVAVAWAVAAALVQPANEPEPAYA
jgi:hypothetical protein